MEKNKILSQEEVEALLSAMKERGDSRDEREIVSASRQVSRYDFRRQDRISEEQRRSLHFLHDYFAHSLSYSLSAYLRAFVEVNLKSVEQMIYSDFLQSLPDPTVFCSISMPTFDSNAAMEISPNLVLPVIDILLGGSGQPPKQVREITDIEQKIIEGFIAVVLRDLKEAWKSFQELDLKLEELGTKPHLLQIIPPGETIVVISFEIKVGENRGNMNLGIPSVLLKVIRHRLDQAVSLKRKHAQAGESYRIKKLIEKVPLIITGEIHGGFLTVEELIRLEPGDVIRFPKHVDDPVLVAVDGVVKLTADVVTTGNRRALQILGLEDQG